MELHLLAFTIFAFKNQKLKWRVIIITDHRNGTYYFRNLDILHQIWCTYNVLIQACKGLVRTKFLNLHHYDQMYLWFDRAYHESHKLNFHLIQFEQRMPQKQKFWIYPEMYTKVFLIRKSQKLAGLNR